jgi:hypothetical protein
MKRLFTIISILMLGMVCFAQKTDTTTVKVDDKVLKVITSNDSTKVFVDNNELSNIDQNKDTTRIRIGNKLVTIIETTEGTVVKVRKDKKESNEEEDQNESDNHFNWDEFSWKRERPSFEGHWAGIEFGINDFLNSSNSMTRSGDDAFMDLNTGKSWNLNLNLLQHSFRLIGNNAGLVTGLGLEFNNYRFDNPITLVKNADGVIIPDTLSGTGISIKKSKLATTYLTLPLLFEFQFPPSQQSSDRIHISVGVIGGLKLGSKTKVVYEKNGDDHTDKKHGDFNLYSLRYGFTGRVGYRDLSLFANYYATPLFEKDKGPELYPFSVGLALGF